MHIESATVCSVIVEEGLGHSRNCRSLLEEELRRRIAERAYFAAQKYSIARNIAQEPEEIWLEAEAIENERLRQELRVRAYFIWRDECRRIGGEVYGNDWYHWFSAQKQMVDTLDSRSLEKQHGVEMAQEYQSLP